MKYLYLFILSMLPIIELRGAIVVAVGMKVNLILAGILCTIGNILAMPIVFIFAKKILNYGTKFKYTKKISLFFLNEGHKAGQKLLAKSEKGIYIALLLFVAIPFPGTGLWTGTFGASLLDLDFKKSFIVVFIASIISGITMLIVSILGFNLFEFLYSLY